MTRSRFALTLASIALVACGSDVGAIRLSIRPNDSKENLPTGVVLGDSLKLYATELDASGTPTASFGHQEVAWTSLTPAIFEIPASGLLVAKAAGAGRVTVTGLKSERTFTVWVYPAAARIVMAPRDSAIDIGQTLTVSSKVFDGNSELGGLATPTTYSLAFTGIAAMEPVSNSAGQFRAVRSGGIWIVGQIDLYKRSALRDSIRVTVR